MGSSSSSSPPAHESHHHVEDFFESSSSGEEANSAWGEEEGTITTKGVGMVARSQRSTIHIRRMVALISIVSVTVGIVLVIVFVGTSSHSRRYADNDGESSSSSSSPNMMEGGDNGGHTRESMSNPNVGITPNDYFLLQSSDCQSELQSLVSSTANNDDAMMTFWNTETHRLWLDIYDNNNNNDDEAVYPLLVCDRTPNKSGYDRVNTILSNAVTASASTTTTTTTNSAIEQQQQQQQRPPPEVPGSNVGVLPLYNGNDQTCIYYPATRTIALNLRRVALSSMDDGNNDNGDGDSTTAQLRSAISSSSSSSSSQQQSQPPTIVLKVQPIIPIMKSQRGTIQRISEVVTSSSSQQQRPIRITAEVVPGFTSTDLQNLLTRIRTTRGNGDGTSKLHIEASFPYTSNTWLYDNDINMTEEERQDIINGNVDVDPFEDYYDNVSGYVDNSRGEAIFLEIDTANNPDAGMMNKYKLLSYVSGLMYQNEIRGVMIPSEFHFNSGGP